MLIWLMVMCFVAAVVYSAVGHGGASAYLAVMGVLGVAQSEMKPIALSLNIVVSLIAALEFRKKGCLRMDLLVPLLLSSVFMAFVGGMLNLPRYVFNWVLGIALFIAALRLFIDRGEDEMNSKRVEMWLLLVVGASIGLVSGMVGVGGGIFLTPLMILLGWSGTKEAAGVSAVFVCLNSVAGLGGFMVGGERVPDMVLYLLPCVLAGGYIGSRWGSGKARSVALRRVLGFVLLVACIKFLL